MSGNSQKQSRGGAPAIVYWTISGSIFLMGMVVGMLSLTLLQSVHALAWCSKQSSPKLVLASFKSSNFTAQSYGRFSASR
jgi:hypothetical protein